MKPPMDIEQDLVEYLRLEYGEDDKDPDALQASDLTYAGSRDEGAVTVHYWEYPASAGKRWVTAEFDGELWSLSMVRIGPDGKQPSTREAFRTLTVRFSCRSKDQQKLPRLRLNLDEMPGGGFPMRFPSGEEVFVYAELYLSNDNQPPGLSLQLLQEDEILLAVRCESGVIILCQIAGYNCELMCGPGPWA